MRPPPSPGDRPLTRRERLRVVLSVAALTTYVSATVYAGIAVHPVLVLGGFGLACLMAATAWVLGGKGPAGTGAGPASKPSLKAVPRG